jgi:hypothetical protein
VLSLADRGPVISRHARAGRRAFSEIVLDSLIASAAADLESARVGNRRRDARRAERRLQRLGGVHPSASAGGKELAAAPAAAPVPLEVGRRLVRSWSLWIVVTLAWLGAVAALSMHLVAHGLHGRVAVSGELGGLALTILWFVLAVLRAPASDDDEDG